MRYFAFVTILAMAVAACGDADSSTTPSVMPHVSTTATTTALPTTEGSTAASTTTTASTTTLPQRSLDDLSLQVFEAGAGFSQPVLMLTAPTDDRWFIVDQPGIIWVVSGRETTVFVDINDLVRFQGEQGLLGMAFHPSYAQNGHFFVDYTDLAGDTQVVRYTVSADPDVADPTSALSILTVAQPASNNNGGTIAFRNDGNLYIGTGDGGFAGDPDNRAQDPLDLLGKILRVNVDNASVNEPYVVPTDNPFVGLGTHLEEIWSVGLRDPRRFSFDPHSGAMWVGDVGQDLWDEVSAEPGLDPVGVIRRWEPTAGGRNFGWRLKEGYHCFDPPVNCEQGLLTEPFVVKRREAGRCAVTGGNVYRTLGQLDAGAPGRGNGMPAYDTVYFYGDRCSRQVWAVLFDGVNAHERELTGELGPAGTLRSFGQDRDG